jgi:hypothetical protein
MASVAKLTADSKPNALAVSTMSLSMVLGTQTSGRPRRWNSWAMASVPSPPMTISASRPRRRNVSTHSSDRSHVCPQCGRAGEGIPAIGRAEDGAAAAQQSRHVGGLQRPPARGFQQPREPVLDPDRLGAVRGRAFHHGPDDGVQSRSVAAAGENPDAHPQECPTARASSIQS